MIQQINNQSVRFKEKGSSDIDYLKWLCHTTAPVDEDECKHHNT